MCYKKENLLFPMDKLGQLTRHHRRPKSLGGKNDFNNVENGNISFVPQRLHEAWHLLFANNSPGRICEVINDHFIDPSVAVIAIPKDMLETIFLILQKTRK